jgi:FKBP-type peptidyl-prolyl cis-trans isomerase SlyD
MSVDSKVQDGQVVSMDYTLKVDDEVVDTSEGHEPIEFIQGTGNIIPGLERELYGMAIGEDKDVVVAASDGYGDMDSEAFMDVPRSQFPDTIPMEIGTVLELHDQSGRPMHARIDQVGDETVRLDFNHPLAGKELHFSIKIAKLRAATDEELEHGHVHMIGHTHEG